MTRRVLLVLLVSAAAACGGSSETARPATRFLSIGTGGTGGVYYPYGGAIARVVTAGIPGVQVTAEVTAASVDNLKLMQLGKVDLALTTADLLQDPQVLKEASADFRERMKQRKYTTRVPKGQKPPKSIR